MVEVNVREVGGAYYGWHKRMRSGWGILRLRKTYVKRVVHTMVDTNVREAGGTHYG
jgi:hypothetical protein